MNSNEIVGHAVLQEDHTAKIESPHDSQLVILNFNRREEGLHAASCTTVSDGSLRRG